MQKVHKWLERKRQRKTVIWALKWWTSFKTMKKIYIKKKIEKIHTWWILKQRKKTTNQTFQRGDEREVRERK